jgi:hypothetical protein
MADEFLQPATLKSGIKISSKPQRETTPSGALLLWNEYFMKVTQSETQQNQYFDAYPETKSGPKVLVSRTLELKYGVGGTPEGRTALTCPQLLIYHQQR